MAERRTVHFLIYPAGTKFIRLHNEMHEWLRMRRVAYRFKHEGSRTQMIVVSMRDLTEAENLIKAMRQVYSVDRKQPALVREIRQYLSDNDVAHWESDLGHMINFLIFDIEEVAIFVLRFQIIDEWIVA